MKKLNYCWSLAVVLAMLFTSCSKEETSSLIDDTSPESAVLTFGAMLDNLANKAMNKGHFAQVPTCSDAEPAVAVLDISYGTTTKTVVVDIKSDANGYFTAYSEDLKIPTPSGGSTEVTLSSFMVYDGDTSSGAVSSAYYSSVYGNLIWIAPKSTNADPLQFAGYVDKPLPFKFNVFAGTKPYIDVEVLCFDRRMVNEYGYIFFDIEQKELIEFCLFGNFCSPEGRHYVASFSADVWLLNADGTKGTQLYDDVMNNYNPEGPSAAPLCLVLPDDLDETDTYYVEITLKDGANYDSNKTGTIVKTLTITDLGVRTFFNNDMITQEYAHFFVDCDEDDIFDEPGSDSYLACLRPLNNSGAIAIASLKLEGNMLSVVMLGTGFKANAMHPQHIHGFTGAQAGTDATCPTITVGTGPGGIITLTDGLPFYGGVQLPLDMTGIGDYPMADGTGSYFYSRTFILTPTQLANVTPLEDMVIVGHGLVVGVTYDASIPVACSEVESSGPVL